MQIPISLFSLHKQRRANVGGLQFAGSKPQQYGGPRIRDYTPFTVFWISCCPCSSIRFPQSVEAIIPDPIFGCLSRTYFPIVIALSIRVYRPVRPGAVFLSPCRGDDPFTGQIIDCSSPLKSYTDAFVSHSRFECTVPQPGAVFLCPSRRWPLHGPDHQLLWSVKVFRRCLGIPLSIWVYRPIRPGAVFLSPSRGWPRWPDYPSPTLHSSVLFGATPLLGVRFRYRSLLSGGC